MKVLRNENIVCFGLPAWEGDYLKSTIQLVSELAKYNRVLYVEYPFTWKDVATATLGKGNAPARRILGRESRLRTFTLESGAAISVLTLPAMLPVNFLNNGNLYDMFMRSNAKRAFHAVNEAMLSLGMVFPVVINAFNPSLGIFLARQFHEKALIYYCYDEINAAKWVSKHGSRHEKLFLREVDAVVTSSQTLFEKKSPLAQRAFLVKNGVDFDLFYQQSNKQTIENQQKIIGYLGSIDERLDYDLLAQTIEALPNNRFVFVGRVMDTEGGARLAKYPNVELKGSQPPKSLPDWVAQFDVCLIPFLKNELTAGIYPLKINEYLACGKPVVTTRFSDLSDFEKVVEIADNSLNFIQLVKKVLTESRPKNQSDKRNTDDDLPHNFRKRRIEFARQNSWANRAEAFGEAVMQTLENKQQSRKTKTAAMQYIPNAFNRWGNVGDEFFKQPQPPKCMRESVIIRPIFSI
jgi:glycosyltransferase involved in cell wall biosynthesis